MRTWTAHRAPKVEPVASRSHHRAHVHITHASCDHFSYKYSGRSGTRNHTRMGCHIGYSGCHHDGLFLSKNFMFSLCHNLNHSSFDAPWKVYFFRGAVMFVFSGLFPSPHIIIDSFPVYFHQRAGAWRSFLERSGRKFGGSEADPPCACWWLILW